MKFGISETSYGHCVCAFQEDDEPLMTVSQPFPCLGDAEQAQLEMEKLQSIGLGEPYASAGKDPST